MNTQTNVRTKIRHRNQLIENGGALGAVARLSQFSPRTGAVLDVGVNRGTIALYLCRLFSDLPIHLIEPIPEQCDYIRERFARFPTVQTHQMALSNKNGTTDFHLADHVGSSSLFTNSSEEAMLNSDHTIAKTFPVKTARLDDWCAKQSIDHISCVKMDAQGSEFNIL